MTDIKHTIGARIRAARKAKGMTQEEFAQKLGLTQGQVSRQEKGSTDLSVTQLGKISSLLGVDISYFVNLKESGEKELSGEAFEIALLWQQLSTEQRTAVKVMIKGLLNKGEKTLDS